MLKCRYYLCILGTDIRALGQQNVSNACVTSAYCIMQGGVALHQTGCRMYCLLALAGHVVNEWYFGKGTDSCFHAA